MTTQSSAGSVGSGISFSAAGENGPKKNRLSMRPSSADTT